MLIQNPHTETVEFTYKGHTYSVVSGGEVSVPTEVAEAWRQTHEFLVVSNDEREAVAPVAPIVEQAEVETAEVAEVAETLVDEIPAAPVKEVKKGKGKSK